MPFPNTIDDDSGGQRVVRGGNGIGEFQSAAAFAERFPVFPRQHGQKLPGDFDAAIVRVTAKEDVGRLGVLLVLDRHGPWLETAISDFVLPFSNGGSQAANDIGISTGAANFLEVSQRNGGRRGPGAQSHPQRFVGGMGIGFGAVSLGEHLAINARNVAH